MNITCHRMSDDYPKCQLKRRVGLKGTGVTDYTLGGGTWERRKSSSKSHLTWLGNHIRSPSTFRDAYNYLVDCCGTLPRQCSH